MFLALFWALKLRMNGNTHPQDFISFLIKDIYGLKLLPNVRVESILSLQLYLVDE